MSNEAAVFDRFVGDVEHHELRVLLDESQDHYYRHLRFKNPTTTIYYFDIVTWPGHLYIGGDISDWVFTRLPDMFEFFGNEQRPGQRLRINPRYWSEKLVAPRPSEAMEFSQAFYKRAVEDWLDEQSASEELIEYASAELLDSLPCNEHEAFDRLLHFEHRGTCIQREAWDWYLMDYRYDFLWACWAIAWGIQKYEEQRAGG